MLVLFAICVTLLFPLVAAFKDKKKLLRLISSADVDVHISAYLVHDLSCGLGVPELSSEIYIAADFYTQLLGSLNSLKACLCQLIAQCGSYAGYVEPVSAREYLLPVEFSCLSLCYGRTCPVIYYL